MPKPGPHRQVAAKIVDAVLDEVIRKNSVACTVSKVDTVEKLLTDYVKKLSEFPLGDSG